MNTGLKELLTERAETYNNPAYFQEDPIIFPKHFAIEYKQGKKCLADVEIAAVFASHLAWGRRQMIVNDCHKIMEEMQWKPFDYIMNGEYRDENASLHRTIKWSEFAQICTRLHGLYLVRDSIEGMSNTEIRCGIFGRKTDLKAPDKKINMMKRWLVRNDGIVDLGVWTKSSPAALLIPLDVHVHNCSLDLGLTSRHQKDIRTVNEITSAFNEIFPSDPCKGDFALFGYGVTHSTK